MLHDRVEGEIGVADEADVALTCLQQQHQQSWSDWHLQHSDSLWRINEHRVTFSSYRMTWKKSKTI